MASLKAKIVEAFVFSSLSRALVKVAAFGSFLIITRHLSLAEYGNVQICFTLLGPAGVFTFLNLEKLITADVAAFRGQNKEEDARCLLWQYGKLGAVLFVVLCVIAFLGRAIITSVWDIPLDKYFFPLLLLVFGQMEMNFVSIVFTSYEKFRFLAMLNTGESFLRFGAVVSLLISGFSVSTVLWAYAFAKLGVTIAATPTVARFMRPFQSSQQSRVQLSPLRTILKQHGKWEVVNGYVDVVTSNLWPWLLHFFVGPAAVGIYAFADKIIGFISSSLPIENSLFPIIGRSIYEKRDRSIILIRKIKKYALFIYVGVVALIFVGAKFFIHIFVPQYISSIPFIYLLCLGFFIDVFALGQASVLYALKQQNLLFQMRIIIIIFRIIVQVVLTYFFGIWGLTISFLVMNIFTVSIREYLLHVKVGLPLWQSRGFFHFDEYDRIALRYILSRGGKIAERFFPSFFH